MIKPVELVFQGLTKRHHVDVLTELCATPALTKLLISVAFATSDGVALVKSVLSPLRQNIHAWVGVRNDVTSWQGLSALLPLVSQMFIIDTGIRHRIFHPKVYIAIGPTEARLAIGSANLTTGGLSQNIEASALVSLPLEDPKYAKIVYDTDELFFKLASSFPQHVKLIHCQAELDELLAAGIVVDETVDFAPRPAAIRDVAARTGDATPAMRLFGGPLPQRQLPPKGERGRGTARQSDVLQPGTVRRFPGLELVWRSGALTRRDLNIPTGSKTNPTGSMLFKKGDVEGIDQRHYFHDEVFKHLTWTADRSKPHLLRAAADFELVIKNINFGVHRLHLTHNSSTTSGAYLQGNSMTQVSWGEVKNYVARDDLLGRRLYLYRNTVDPRRFTLEID
jgi:HKD family nuclease